MVDPFAVLWSALLAVPPITVLGYVAVKKWRPTSYWRIAAVAAAYLAVVVGGLLLHLRLIPRLLEVCCVALAYLALCCLLTASVRIPWPWLRTAGVLLAAVPVAIGYALGTVGALALAFMVGDWTDDPRHIERIRPDLECRVTAWGMVASDSGYTVHLLRLSKLVPFIEREVVTITVDEINSGDGPREASCADATKVYSS